MSERTLGKARGLNSIADPSAFKGSRGSGRRRPRHEDETALQAEPDEQLDEVEAPVGDRPTGGADPATERLSSSDPARGASTGADVDHRRRADDAPPADPAPADGAGGDRAEAASSQVAPTRSSARPTAKSATAKSAAAKPSDAKSQTGSSRGGDEGDRQTRRKRRELSIPLPVADALNETGINPADVVMGAYRKFADSIYAGTGGRLMSRGRERVRLSISDAEFDKITRLGRSRGWNRSETVAVLLTMELLDEQDLAEIAAG